MTKANDGVDDVAKLLEKTKVEQLNIVSFKGKSLKLNTEEDGKLTINTLVTGMNLKSLKELKTFVF